MSLFGWVLVYFSALVRREKLGIQRENRNSLRDEELRSCSDTVKLTSGKSQINHGLTFMQIRNHRLWLLAKKYPPEKILT